MSINVKIFLDTPHAHFTNLDEISGRVSLKVSTATNVSSVVVKLEGESRTRLLAPPDEFGRERPRPVVEVHKLLYKVVVVWPPQQLQDEVLNQRNYTLPVGAHEYPFKFKLPFNNSCSTHTQNQSLAQGLGFAGLTLEAARLPTQHVKATLPPTVYFPGEAEIKYFVKTTVNRPSLFKENPRDWAAFGFFPIEPPRGAPNGEAYARRQHQFNPEYAPGGKKNSTAGLFSRTKSIPTSPTSEPPRFSLEARLPNPAIITCNSPIPLKILLKNLSERSSDVFLQTLQVELIGYTKIRAHEAVRTETNSWPMVSKSNLAMPLGSPSDPVGTETEITKEFWHGIPLPNTVAPTFVTCNIERWYDLDVRVGLGYGASKQILGQFTVLPLRIPVKIFSGITPPDALLQAVRLSQNTALNSNPNPLKPSLQVPPSSQPPISPSSAFPPSPSTAFAGPSNPPPWTAHPPHHGHHQHPGEDMPRPGAVVDAPPSYEDAIASDMPPIDGPRPDYVPPPSGAPVGDEKRRGSN
ncbi:hypothetical protein K402DRAFT_391761 [Aulographum hederae CBS 113979]|uniref:Arrestin-like N-terminal domain-containing protein n=1 Tax=Aulographum hederae CBS 113979 TaxID=1176131 RepID=A0A6G1H656_9PEZI|nr:hypothetical protein K402DRAFT_391761 [Aulographum hederae CBS 113979]